MCKTTNYALRIFSLFLALAIVFSIAFAPADAWAKSKKHSRSSRQTENSFTFKDKFASIVVEAESGRILSKTNSDKQLHPASLTKMMTLYLTFEALEEGRLKRNTYLEVTRNASRQKPSSLGMRAGENIRTENAILAVVTKSANDMAVTLAESISGSEQAFARKMTMKAKELGMSRTNFANASGLYNKNQYSTARDLAILARALIKHYPQYYHYFSTPQFTYNGITYTNHNKLMQSYPGMDGLKTGFIDASGFNLAASAKRDGKRLIGVVFGGRTSRARNMIMQQLLDQGFQHIGNVQVSSLKQRQMQQNVPERRPSGGDGYTIRTASANSEVYSLQSKLVEQIQNEFAFKATKEQGDAPILEEERSRNAGKWTIQVGSFKNEQAGLKALKEVKKNIVQLVEAKDVVAPLVTNRGTVYRARITGLTLSDARNACNILQGKCLILTSE